MLKLEKSRNLVPISDYFGAEELRTFSMGAKNRSKKAVFTPPNIYAKNAKNVSGHLFSLVYPPRMTKIPFCKCILIRYCLDMAWLPPFLAGSQGPVSMPKCGFWTKFWVLTGFDQKGGFWPKSAFLTKFWISGHFRTSETWSVIAIVWTGFLTGLSKVQDKVLFRFKDDVLFIIKYCLD